MLLLNWDPWRYWQGHGNAMVKLESLALSAVPLHVVAGTENGVNPWAIRPGRGEGG